MSLIDLVIPAFTDTLAASNTAQYARIDNTATPVFTTVPGIAALPFDLTPNGVPDGQYQVTFGPNYPNGASCPVFTFTTPACPGMIAVSAVQTGNNIVVNYTAPTTGPSGQPIANVSITINGPNGSVYNATVTNGTNGGQIVYPIPTGIYGNYTISMQTVCDATSGFFGPASPAITVPIAAPITNPSLSGTLTIVPVGDCSGTTCGNLVFNLTQPLANDLTLQMAYTFTSPSGALEPIQQYGCSLIPPNYIAGTCVMTGYASFVLPAGVFQVTIPFAAITFTSSPQGGSGTQCVIAYCSSNPLSMTTYVSQIFFHAANQPTIQFQLTPIDNRITIIPV